MSESVQVVLNRPIETLNGLVSTVTVKVPTYGDIITGGELFTIGETKEGTRLLLPNPTARQYYLTKLVIDENGQSLGASAMALDYRDGRKIEAAINRFFGDNAEAVS